MKARLAFCLILLPIAAFSAAENTPPGNQGAAAGESPRPVSLREFALEIRAIAGSRETTLKDKQDRISAALQSAVLGAISSLKDPVAILKTALQFGRIAAQAAPQFAEIITQTLSGIPAIAAIEGAPAQIQAAVLEAATRAAEVEFSSDRSRFTHDPEFGGHTGDTVVSRYR